MVKFNKNQLPPEMDWQECQTVAYREKLYGESVFEPEFCQWWNKYFETDPDRNDPVRKGHWYHGWKLQKRDEAINALLKIPQPNTFHRIQGKSCWVAQGDDIEINIQCKCGYQFTVRDADADHLCTECGRVYRLRLQASVSDFLIKEPE